MKKIETENLGDTMKHSSKIAILTLTLGALLLSGLTAKADSTSLGITLSPSSQTIVAGSTTPLVIDATFTNNEPWTLDLYADTGLNIYNLSGGPGLPGDDLQVDNLISPNFNEFLASGASESGDLIDLTLSDPATAPGVYEIEYEIVNARGHEIGSQVTSFTVTAPTPEPASLLLIVTGLIMLACTLHRDSAQRKAMAPSCK